MRANLDGSQVEGWSKPAAVNKDQLDATRWCVGITIDPKFRKIYWTQKGPDNAGLGRLCRANIDIPRGESPANRSDIEVLFDRLPEPIDLELDLANRVLYWTDRGDPPRGNTVNRAPIDKKAVPEILITHLMEGIRHRSRRSRQPDVRHRLRRFGLFRRSRRQERAQLPLRPGKSHRHRLRRNLNYRKENQSCPPSPFAASPSSVPASSARANRAVSRQGTTGRRDGHRAERRSRAEEIRGSRLAGAQAIGPVAWSVAVEPEVHGRSRASGRWCRPGPGERARAHRLQAEALWAARRAAAARRNHRVKLVGAHHERNPVGRPVSSGALRHRPSVQSAALDSAG